MISAPASRLQAAPSFLPGLAVPILLGVVLWLLATLLIRVAGHVVLRPEEVWLWGTFILGGPLIAFLAVLLRRALVPPSGADALALGIVGPGLLLDVGTTLAFATAYPNLAPSLDLEFAALMLWGYGLIALVIPVEARLARQSGPE